MVTAQMKQIGIVRKRTKSFYYVSFADGEPRLCRVKGNLFQESRYDEKIAVGDRVEADPEAAEDAGLIYRIEPRTTELARNIPEREIRQVLVANANQLLIVAAVRQPTFRHGVVDRLIVAGLAGGLEPVIVLNKIDLATEAQTQNIAELYRHLGYVVLTVSALQGTLLDAVREQLHLQTSVLAGHSGVGKSSLVKALFPDWEIRVGAVNQKIGKGRHTTTLAEMFPLPEGGYLVDTPGVRELRPWGVQAEELDQYFVEFVDRVGCRFPNCTHRHEPDCAVKAAVQAQRIQDVRYQSYLALYDSLSPRR
jgi:ribosome biogenesis GTPase